MPSFSYIALTPAGERVVGILSGASEQTVLAELESRKLTAVRVEAEKEGRGLLWNRPGQGAKRIPARQLALAYIQLGDLLRAGVPLMRGIRLLAARKSSPRLAAVFTELADQVADGAELAESMSQRPASFSRVHVAMVRAGEKGGFLDSVFTRLGQFLLAQADLRAKVIGSLIYPSLLVVVCIGVMALVFGVFVPQFRPIFAKLEQTGDLPGLTKVLLAASSAAGTFGIPFFILLAILAVGLWQASRRPAIARKLSIARLRAPILGPLTRTLAIARFCRVLGTMLANSIPMLTSMQIARDASGNVILEEAIDRATEAVRHGQPLAPPLTESGLFPDDVIEMIAVGESANNLDEVLITIADTLEQRIDRMLGVALKLVEPMLLLLMAVLIGFVAAGLILPMSQLSRAVR